MAGSPADADYLLELQIAEIAAMEAAEADRYAALRYEADGDVARQMQSDMDFAAMLGEEDQAPISSQSDMVAPSEDLARPASAAADAAASAAIMTTVPLASIPIPS